MAIVDLRNEPEHIDTLASWHHQEWAYLNRDGSLEKRIAEMQSYLDGGFIPSTYVYKQGEQLAGSSAIVSSDMDTHKELSPWLASVYVSPDFRCRGLGSQLVQHVMQQAKANGIEKLYLFTPDQENFYARLGWSVLGKEDYRGQFVTIMQVELNT